MSTELQKQVSAFKKKTAQVQSLQRGVPSIFLGPKEAAAVDTSAVYEAGCKGLQDLLQYDERFRAFESSLFHSSSVNLQRELKTKEENAAIDVEINSILGLLSLWAGEPSAHLVLEYLVRRYRVHEFNMDALLRAFLVVHDTKIFAKIVHLCRLEDTPWVFLVGVKDSGVPPPRSLFVHQAMKSPWILDTVCDITSRILSLLGIKKSSPKNNVSSVEMETGFRALAFTTAIIVEVANKSVFREDMLRNICLLVIEGLKSKIRSQHSSLQKKLLADWKVSSCVVISQISVRTQFGDSIIKAFSKALGVAIAMVADDSNMSDVLDTLLTTASILAQGGQLLVDQNMLNVLFSEAGWFFQYVENAETNNQSLLTLIGTSVFKAAAKLFGEQSDETAAEDESSSTIDVPSIVVQFLKRGWVDERDIADLLSSILRSIADKKLDSDKKTTAEGIVRAMSDHYPHIFNNVVKATLADGAKAKAVTKFLSAVFSEFGQSKTTQNGDSVFLNLSSAIKELRMHALSTLESSSDIVGPVAASGPTANQLGIVDAVMRCLADTDDDVASQAWNTNIVSIVFAVAGPARLFDCIQLAWQSWSQEASLGSKSALSVLHRLIASIEETCISTLLEDPSTSSAANAWVLLITTSSISLHEQTESKTATKVVNAARSLLSVFLKKHHITEKKAKAAKGESVDFVSLLVTSIADDHHHALLPIVEKAVQLIDSDYTLRGFAVFLVRMATALQQHKHLSSLHTLLAKALAPLMSRYLVQTTVTDAVSATTYSRFVQVLLPTMVSLASGTYTSFDASLRNSLQPLTAEHRMEAVFLQLLASQGVSGEMLHAALETVDRNDVLVLMARFLQSPVDAQFPVDETAVRTISLCSVHAILLSSVNVGTACIPTLLHLLYLASSATSSLRTLASQCFKSFAQLVASNSTRSLPLNKELSVNVAEISALINAIVAQIDLVATDGDAISSIVYETLSKASATLGTLSEAIFMAATSISAAHDRYASFLIKLLPTVFVEKNWKGIVAFLSQATGRVTGEQEGFLSALLTWIANGFKTLPAEKQAAFITWLCDAIKSAKSLEATLPRLLLTIVVPLLATGSLSSSAFEELLRCLFAVQSNTNGSKDVVRAILSMEVDPALGMALLHDALNTTEEIDALLRIRKNSIVDEDAADESRMQVDEDDDDEEDGTTGGATAVAKDEGVRDYESKQVSISAKLRSMVAVAEMVVPMVLAKSAYVQHHASALFRALFNLLDKLCQPGCVSVINLEFYKTMICELLLQLLNRAATEQCLTHLFATATAGTAAVETSKTPSKSSKGSKKKAAEATPAATTSSSSSTAAYSLALARKDIGSILHCLSSVRSSNIQGSALGVLRHIIHNFTEAMPALIELLGDFLSQTSAHGTHLLTRGKILVSLLSIIVPTGDQEASKSVSLATRDIVFHVLQALPGMPSNHRAALLKALAKLEDHREWMSLLIVQNLLQHTLVRYESKVAETANVTVESISLSRAAQRRAQRVLLTSDSEEFFHMAEQFLLDQSSASIIKSVIKILDASRALTLFCIGNDASSSTSVDTDDVARLLHHFNTLRRREEATSSSAATTAAADAATQRGQAASMAVLQLEFINEILLSPQFHRQLAADMLGNRVTHNDMMEVAECALQICVECESLRQARQRSTQRAILLRLENEAHHLSAKLLSEIFADLSLNVLGNMQVLLDGPSFLTMIQELLDHEVPAIRQRAIIFLKDRLQSLLSEKRMSQIEHGLYLDLCGRLRAIIKANLTKLFAEKVDAQSTVPSSGTLSLPYAQSALLAIDVLVLKLGKTPQWQTVVMDILGEYLSYFDAVYAMVGLRSSSGHYQQKALESRKFLGSLMLSCSSLCMALHAAALPVFPSLMEKTLHVFVAEASQWRDDTVRAMNLDSDRRAHVLFLRSLISATSIMFSSLPKFSHPYIATILPLLLEVSTSFASSREAVDVSGMDDDAEACLTVIGNELPPRLALPAVCSCLRESVALGGDALHRYVALLQVLVTKADRATCVNNMATLLPAVLALMKALKTTTPHFQQHSFADAQDGIGELVVEICLKLTENELKTFIVRLSDWKSGGHQSGHNNNNSSNLKEKETVTLSEEDEEDKFYRYVHFYATIKALLDRFQTLFFSSMALLWTDMMGDLDAHAKFVKRLLDKTKANSDNEDGGSKKRKRSVDLYALLTESNKLVLSLLFDAVGHVMSITKALCTFTGATFFDEKRYETIYPKILTFVPMWQAFDGDESYFSFARDHLITALCELCLNINRDLLWKPLNHQVLLYTRNASPLVRIVAVDLLRELFEKVGADYLAVLPECLSYISELLEDDNSEVVKHTRQAIAVIEELSGESLDTYLQ